MNGWISTSERLPCEGAAVLIWDGGFYVARIRHGISEEQRAAMSRGEIADPVSEHWSATTGSVLLKRSEVYTSADVFGNNLVPYCWDAVAGMMTWCGQNVKYWRPLPPAPEE